jgi:thiopurine S-methyltransferase
LLIAFEYDQNALPGPPHAVPTAELWLHYGRAYRLALVDVHTVPGGLKGITPAHELVWLLQP